jgi:hypothetical protein
MKSKPTLGHQHYIVGYGSLLSHDSRLRHSDINEMAYPLLLTGWQRAWVTRSEGEGQTYVGATKQINAVMNGALIPTHEITPELEKRESNYRFTPLSVEDFSLTRYSDIDESALKGQLKERSIWICETLETHPAEKDYPVYQSYVDTCLIGCMEIGGKLFVQDFIKQTVGWDNTWVNDRHNKQYPRYAKVNRQQEQSIDHSLKSILHRRLDSI